ncbi:MAG: type IV pilin [Halobacteriota archaeon]
MSRAIAPVLGTVVLVGIVVLTAGTLGLLAVELSESMPETVPIDEAAQRQPIDLTVDGTRLVFTNNGSEPIDVRDLNLAIRVDGSALRHQPSVPFFSIVGFEPGPVGAFNSAGTSTWEVGESTSLSIASTNDPLPEPGSRIVVEVAVDGRHVATVEAVT